MNDQWIRFAIRSLVTGAPSFGMYYPVEDAVLRDDRALLILRGVAALKVDVPRTTHTRDVLACDLPKRQVILIGEIAPTLGKSRPASPNPAVAIRVAPVASIDRAPGQRRAE